MYRLPEQLKSERYRQIITKEVRSAFNKRQFVESIDDRDFDSMDGLSGELIGPMEWLLDLSKKHCNENRPEESLLISKAILEEVPGHLLHAMGLSTTDYSSVERHLNLLDRLIDEFKKHKQSFIGEHQLQEIKITYLQQIGRAKQAVEVMLSVKDDPTFCLMLVRHYIEKKHFEEAKVLCMQGLEKANAVDKRIISWGG